MLAPSSFFGQEGAGVSRRKPAPSAEQKPANAGLRRLLFWPEGSRLTPAQPASSGQRSRLTPAPGSRLLPKKPACTGSRKPAFAEEAGLHRLSRLLLAKPASFWPEKEPAYTEPAPSRCSLLHRPIERLERGRGATAALLPLWEAAEAEFQRVRALARARFKGPLGPVLLKEELQLLRPTNGSRKRRRWLRRKLSRPPPWRRAGRTDDECHRGT